MHKGANTLAFLGAALPAATEGALVYSGWLDQSVPAGGLTIQIAGNGVDLGRASLRFDASSFLSSSVLYHSAVFAINTIGILGYGSAYPVFFGQTLNPADLAGNGIGPMGGGRTLSSGTGALPALDQTVAWGFKSAGEQFGLIRTRMEIENGSARFTLLDWAFETEPNTAVTIPEPGATGLAALALGAAALVRRRRKDPAARSQGQ